AMHIRRTNWSDVSTDAIEYLHRDHLGSIEVTSSSAGTAVDQRGYDPFGGRRATDWSRELTAAEKKAIADGGDEPAERGYTDHEMLDRTGLIHMNGRVYDPEIGRFLSADPIVQAPDYSQSWNRYAYVMNSPMSYTDPSGYIRQPSSAGDICAASPVCLNMNDSNGGPSGGSTSYGVPSTRISVTIFEERRLGSSEDIFWPRVFGGGFGRGIPGGNDRYGLPALIDRILRIEIDNVELINRRVETRSTRMVSTTEGSETDEALSEENERFETELQRAIGKLIRYKNLQSRDLDSVQNRAGLYIIRTSDGYDSTRPNESSGTTVSGQGFGGERAGKVVAWVVVSPSDIIRSDEFFEYREIAEEAQVPLYYVTTNVRTRRIPTTFRGSRPNFATIFSPRDVYLLRGGDRCVVISGEGNCPD
ncbi:MAG: RHS repeat-associated core domain-containing protein, partial [Pseudomonadota bacterium]